jgi:hypothetical protein
MKCGSISLYPKTDTAATYETIDSLQLAGDYDEIRQIAQYAVDAIVNDEEKLRLRLPRYMRKVPGTER